MGFRPNWPKSVFAKGEFGKTHPYALAIIFMSILVWYLAKRAPFRYQKIPKNLKVFVDLFVGPSHFILFSFFMLVFF